MITTDVQTKLALLDYSTDWITSGILTESDLDHQLQEFSEGEDTNKEHYRYKTLLHYLKLNPTLSDKQVEQIAMLMRKDVDTSMAGSVLTTLLKMPGLTEKQFQLVSSVLVSFGSWAEKHIKKEQQIRDANNGGITANGYPKTQSG